MFIELVSAEPATPKPLQHSEMPPNTNVVMRAPLRPRLLKIARIARPAAKRMLMTTPTTLMPTTRASLPSSSVPAYTSR